MRIGSIQALRAIGALLVVFQHVSVYVLMARGIDFEPYLRFDFGRAGVLLFFVISGFVMSGCLKEGRAFLANRALRIYPGFWIAAAISFLLVGTHYGWKALLLAPHQIVNSPYTVPYWTLIYEAMFYLLTYVAILAGLQRRGLTVALIAWLASLVVVGKYVQVPLLVPAGWIWFSTLNAFYILGMLAGLYRDEVEQVATWRLALFAVLAWAASEGLAGTPVAYQTVLACACVTFVLAALRWKWSTLLQRMGDCSYGLYLLHVPLIGVAVHALKDSGVRVSLFWIGTFAFATAGGLAFGWLEFRLHRAAKGLRQTLGWTRPDARTAGVP